MPLLHFLVFVLVSLVVFVAMVRVSLRRRAAPPDKGRVAIAAFLVVVVGMVFAKWGANTGLHWSVYYGLPAAMTVFLPPVLFRMRGWEILEYLVMASLNAPAIHVVFSLLFGWNEYMPFLHIPSLWMGNG